MQQVRNGKYLHEASINYCKASNDCTSIIRYCFLLVHLSIYLSNLYSTSSQIFTSYQKRFTIFHLCKAFQCFIPLWEGASSSQINSLGSIQVPCQLYLHFCFSATTWGNAWCFCIRLIAPPTILQSGRIMVVGHVPTVHTCSFMCTNHIDMIAHTLAFLWVGEHSHHPDFHHASRGWLAFFPKLFQPKLFPGQIRTLHQLLFAHITVVWNANECMSELHTYMLHGIHLYIERYLHII